MVGKYGSLLALGAALLVVGCGSDRLFEKDEDDLADGESTLSCHQESQPIYHAFQAGSGVSVGDQVIFRGVIHAEFMGKDKLNGFYIQSLKSDFQEGLTVPQGIFVDGSDVVRAKVGDEVVVQATLQQNEEHKYLDSVEGIGYCNKGRSIVYTDLSYPLDDPASLERYAGMAVRVTGIEYIVDTSRLGSQGELLLATELATYPTETQAPGAEAFKQFNELTQPSSEQYRKNRLILDDGSYKEYPGVVIYPEPELLASNTLRLGDRVLDLKGVITTYQGVPRLHASEMPMFMKSNLRNKEPELATKEEIEAGKKDKEAGYQRTEDELRLATVNTWRYQPKTHSFVRQRPKITALFSGLDADVLAVQQVRNDGTGQLSSLADLVDMLNADTENSPYRYVVYSEEEAGEADVLNAILYRSDRVKEIGQVAVLTLDATSQPVVAQSFEHLKSGKAFTFVAAQLAERTCTADSNQSELLKDHQDGQACASLARQEASHSLLNWIALSPTGNATAPVIIAGEMNAYRQEAPVQAIEAAGFYNSHDLIQQGYTWAEKGFVGNLDYVFVDTLIQQAVVSADTWKVNADEPVAFNYEVINKTSRYQNLWYQQNEIRSAERNPVVVRLDTKAF